MFEQGLDGAQLRPWRQRLALTAGALVLVALAACGGGGSSDAAAPNEPPVVSDKPTDREDAARFLAQASFGPTPQSIDRVMSLGFRGWLEEQFAAPASSRKAAWEEADAAIKAADPTNADAGAGTNEVVHAFYRGALGDQDQLRQRVAFALSQILVISMQDNNVSDFPRGVAAYMDVLGDGAFGNYRKLLEDVSRHPMMGLYLTSLRNRKEDPRTGRVPDENYAREVMQLFTIGLHELDAQGQPRRVNGELQETYTAADIAGLAKVFTGWSWGGPDPATPADLTDARFNASNDASRHANRDWKPMLGYPQHHSVTEKVFLGTTIGTQSSANPQASLTTALDRLFNHPNVGPFIGKLMIQRLVTSNPSPAYVGRVAAAFADNGAGVRGDMKAVVKAILLDAEARDVAKAADPQFGKLREPVLRLTAYLRAYGATSDSGRWMIGTTDNPGTQLGQTPMRAPSVFNFYRPGYVAPGSASGDLNLAAPELQITHETSVAGYANFMRDVLQNGVGSRASGATRNDVQASLAAAAALADRPSAAQPEALVDDVNQRLMAGTMSAALKALVTTAVASVPIPATNQTNIDAAKLNRARLAIYLALVSPEFIVQK